MSDLVDIITGELQQGNSIDALLDHPGGARAETADLVAIARGLHETLVPVEPSDAFCAQLRTQLLESQPGMLARVRQMPARVHVAAILAVFAGFSLLLSRRLFGDSGAQEISDEPVATAL